MGFVALPEVERVVVVGAGTMGVGICQTILAANLSVHLVDTRPDALQAATVRLKARFDSLAAKGKLQENPEATLERLTVGTLKDSPPFELLIEAVAEVEAVKEAVFFEGYSLCPDALFASNTSSLSINKLAESFPAPDRLFGLHFFNPAPLMPLVEVIQGVQNPDVIAAWAKAFCITLGKTPVHVKDSPGFIVNRVARPFYTEAMRTSLNHTIPFEAIDKAMRSQGFKMGPYQLMDMIGMDINLNVTRLVWEGLEKPNRFIPNILQTERVERGDFGVKTGKGFYEYPKTH
jgi:3-hydroxybutyryl-CoA dehydrogenase